MPPKRRRFRWLLWPAALGGGSALLGFIALYAWLRSDDFQRRAAGAIESVIESQTGEQATLREVSVSFWPLGASVGGLHLWDTDDGETIASVEEIHAFVGWNSGPTLGQVILDSPVVQLRLGDDGKLKSFDHRPPGPKKPLKKIPWQSLVVTDGTFRLQFKDGEVAVEAISVSSDGGPVSDVSGSLQAQIRDLLITDDFLWEKVEIGPDRIVIPDLKLDTAPLDLTGSLTFPLEGDIDARIKGEALLPELNPLLVAPRELRGSTQFDLALHGPSKEPEAELTLVGSDLGFTNVAKTGRLIHHGFGDMHASIHATKDGATIEKAVFRWGEGDVVLTAEISKRGEVQKGHIDATNLSMAQVLRQLDAFPNPWVDFRSNATVDFGGTLKPFHLDGPMDFALRDFRVAGGPIDDRKSDLKLAIPYGSIGGRFSVEPQEVILRGDRITAPRSRARATVTIGTRVGTPIDIRADLWQADLEDLRPLGTSELKGKGTIEGRIWGEAGAFHCVGTGDLRSFAVTGLPYADHLVADISSPDMKRLIIDNARGIRGTTQYGGRLNLGFQPPMTMDLDIIIPNGRIEDVLGVFIDLPGFKGGMEGTLNLTGPMYDLTGESHLVLSNVDLWGEQFPSGKADGYMDQGLFTLDDLRLERDTTSGLVLRGGIDRKWALNMELYGDGLRLERLDHLMGRNVPITGNLSFVTRIDNTLFEPAPHGRIAATDVRFRGTALEDSRVTFGTEAGVAQFHGDLLGNSVDVDGSLGLWKDQPYDITASFTEFPAHLAWPIAADGQPILATVDGDLALSGNFGEHPSPVDLAANASAVRVSWGRHVLTNPSPWRYTQKGTAFNLENFDLAGGISQFTFAAAGGDQPLQVAGTGKIDMDLLRLIVPGLERSDGLAAVQVRATGRRPHVQAEVDVELDGALIRHRAFPASIEDLRATIRGSRDGYQILEATAGVGGGEVMASGSLRAERWIPTDFHLRADATDSQIQWIEDLPPAIGDAHIQLDGPPSALLLAGDVHIDDMTFADRIDWEDWLVEFQDQLLVSSVPTEDVPLFSIDVGIHADHTIRLQNNVAEGEATASLRVIGDTVRPGLVGSVRLHDTIAFLQDREFRVRRGDIVWRDPWTWDPDLDFDLVTDIDSQKRRFRVNYLIRGPFSNWGTETRSDPPLAQADINALLWFGATAEELEEMGELPQAIGQGVADLFIADLFLTNQAAQELRGELPNLFDRFDLVTGVDARGEYSPDPRLLVQKKIRSLRDAEVTWEIGLTRSAEQFGRIDLPITRNWSLSGWYASRQRDRNLPIGGAYGLDLRGRWGID